ncbi:MAG: hypothetical protein WB607_13390 [Candidatus Acidiferrum sp.]
MPDLGEVAVDSCYEDFRRHCIDVHGLNDDKTAEVFLNLEAWTLTLLK